MVLLLYTLGGETVILGIIFYARITLSKLNRKDSICSHFRGLILSSLRSVLFLPAYWIPFSSYMPGETRNQNQNDNHHWAIKICATLTYSYFIIMKFIANDYNKSFLTLSIIDLPILFCHLYFYIT